MNLYNKINNQLKTNSIDHAKIQSLIENKKIYTIGKNMETINVSKKLDIEGIIDDFSKEETWNGIKIYNSKKINKDSCIINCSTSISPISVKKNLSTSGLNNVIDYFELVEFFGDMKKPIFSIDAVNDFNENYDKWEKLYSILKDDESKELLVNILLFRISFNPKYMRKYGVRLKDQYMEKFMEYSNETMVDAGGFDGETTEIFCNKYKDYNQIYLFEPSEKNFELCRSNLSKIEKINYYKIGLSDSKQTLQFTDNIDSACTISDFGNVEINVDTIDDVVKEKITFIKMDIEGWELSALKGATNHIKNNHPKLAIAVYHNIKDFWQIAEFVLNIRSDYDVYIRHYTEGWSETIMYFKPKMKN